MSLSIQYHHPCFSAESHFKAGRIHLPVAPECNLGCNYCDKKVGACNHSYRPSLASEILTPQQALEIVMSHADKKWLKVIGIAGPGEPLFNRETFETLDLLNQRAGDLTLCICTNGLLLSHYAAKLKELGVEVITITVNAVDEKVAGQIYSFVEYEGSRLTGLKASRLLISKQLEGVEKAVEEQMLVKINSILIPGVNDVHMIEVARAAAARGAHIQNITPLIPLAGFKDLRPPSLEEIQSLRNECEQFLPQFRHCKQCRADSIGIPGLE